MDVGLGRVAADRQGVPALGWIFDCRESDDVFALSAQEVPSGDDNQALRPLGRGAWCGAVCEGRSGRQLVDRTAPSGRACRGAEIGGAGDAVGPRLYPTIEFGEGDGPLSDRAVARDVGLPKARRSQVFDRLHPVGEA